jgi:hypothetical protein
LSRNFPNFTIIKTIKMKTGTSNNLNIIIKIS